MASLTERYLKLAKGSTVLSQSPIFKDIEAVTTRVPLLNVAFSGRVTGGYVPGITVWAGPSKHFKTMFCLIQAAGFLNKHPDGVIVLFDTEFGAPLQYFQTCGIDPDRVVHIPVFTAEELRTELTRALKATERGDKVFFMIDSIGNVASNKEVNDAEADKEAADFTRAKVLKSLFRIATPHFAYKNLDMAVINHTYETIEMFSKQVMGGGKGPYYAANNIFFLGRQQDATGQGVKKELHGYNYTIRVEKSRFVKEGSKFDVTVNFDDGLDRYSGLMELAIATGFMVKINDKMISAVNQEDGTFDEKGKMRSWWEKNTQFWEELIVNPAFDDKVAEMYTLGGKASLIAGDNDDS